MTNTEFKVGDEVRISLPAGDMFHHPYHGKIGTITRIEERDEHFIGLAGYYVNFDDLSVFRALDGEISHVQPVPEPTAAESALDDIRSHRDRISNAPWHTEYGSLGDEWSGVSDDNEDDAVPLVLHGPYNYSPTYVPERNVVTAFSELSRDDFEFIAKAPEYVSRLLDIIDAIEEEIADSEAHALPYGDSAVVYTEVIRQIIGDVR